MTRSGRISKPPQIFNLHQSHLQAKAHQEVPYSLETACVIVVTMCHLKAIYGDIESIGFEVNPYAPCVANCIVTGKQHSVLAHQQ
jgi:hypothetical protein